MPGAFIATVWFLCGIAGFYVGQVQEQKDGRYSDAAFCWLIFFGPILLIGCVIAVLDKDTDEEERCPEPK